MSPRLILVAPYRGNGRHVHQVPAGRPRLVDLEREVPALRRRRIAEVELTSRQQLRGLRLKREGQEREQPALAGDRDGAIRMPQAVAPDPDPAGRDRRRDQAARVVEPVGALDRSE